jgi:hypothetical protein
MYWAFKTILSHLFANHYVLSYQVSFAFTLNNEVKVEQYEYRYRIEDVLENPFCSNHTLVAAYHNFYIVLPCPI